MTLAPISRVEICDNCNWVALVGNWDPDWVGSPLPTPEPLGLLGVNYILGQLMDENENEISTPSHFSAAPCPTCGQRLAGERYEFDLYYIGNDKEENK